MIPVFTEHARTRAIERYKLILTDAELIEIHAACIAGKAPGMHKDDDATVHIFTFKGHRVYPVISVASKRLVTFMPLDFFAPGHRAEWIAEKTGTIRKQVPRAPKIAPRRHERQPTRQSLLKDWEDM